MSVEDRVEVSNRLVEIEEALCILSDATQRAKQARKKAMIFLQETFQRDLYDKGEMEFTVKANIPKARAFVDTHKPSHGRKPESLAKRFLRESSTDLLIGD